jgi:methylated-DNA-[protein]-cysteine S-methyltransferase
MKQFGQTREYRLDRYTIARIMGSGIAFFDTPIGRCGIAWAERGIVGVQLPESNDVSTRARMLRRFPNARELKPPADVRRAIDGIAALLRGAPSDLSTVILDMAGVPGFNRRVYEIARAIPVGATLSYGEIATRLGKRDTARAVGQALGRNPFAIVVPCHRVLAAGGKLGGFSAAFGVKTKQRLLSIEREVLLTTQSPAAESVEEVVAVAAVANRSPARLGDGGLLVLGSDQSALGFDPGVAVEHLRASDPALARVIDAVGPFRMQLKKASNTFTVLAEAIVYQQLTGRAAATIFGRVCGLFPDANEGPTAEHIMRVSDDKLRAAGLSRAKLLSLRDLARRTAAGEIPTLADIRNMENEAIIERLTAVRGIGRWTVEMLLIFRLGRPDVLPLDDYGVRKGFGFALRKRALPTRKDLEKRGGRWKPYRTVASWYLWRASELAKKSSKD